MVHLPRHGLAGLGLVATVRAGLVFVVDLTGGALVFDVDLIGAVRTEGGGDLGNKSSSFGLVLAHLFRIFLTRSISVGRNYCKLRNTLQGRGKT